MFKGIGLKISHKKLVFATEVRILRMFSLGFRDKGKNFCKKMLKIDRYANNYEILEKK